MPRWEKEPNDALRVCRVCGKTAFNEADLNLFARDNNSDHDRKRLCKECASKDQKKFRESHLDYVDKMNKQRGDTRISFKEKHIRLDLPPRTGVCSICGKKYPKELKRRTILHHDEYDEKNPLSYTREVCQGCHNKIHFKGKTRTPLEDQAKRRMIWRLAHREQLSKYNREYGKKRREEARWAREHGYKPS